MKYSPPPVFFSESPFTGASQHTFGANAVRFGAKIKCCGSMVLDG